MIRNSLKHRYTKIYEAVGKVLNTLDLFSNGLDFTNLFTVFDTKLNNKEGHNIGFYAYCQKLLDLHFIFLLCHKVYWFLFWLWYILGESLKEIHRCLIADVGDHNNLGIQVDIIICRLLLVEPFICVNAFRQQDIFNILVRNILSSNLPRRFIHLIRVAFLCQ